MRKILAGIAVVGLSALLSFFPSFVTPGAIADIIAPVAPPALNILPSVIRGTLPVTGTIGQNQMTLFLYKFAQTPAFWNAVKAQTAGVATAGQLEVVSTVETAYAVPATKFASLVKVAGAAGAVVSAFQIGATLSNGVQDMLGLDATGTVCRNTGSGTGLGGIMLEIISGASCGTFDMAQQAIDKANQELTATQTWPKVCYLTLCVGGGSLRYVADTYSNGSPNTKICVPKTGSNPASGSGTLNGLVNGGVNNTGSSSIGFSPCTSTEWFFGAHAGTTATVSGLYIQWGGSAPGTSPVSVAVNAYPDPNRNLKCDTLGSNGVTYTKLSAPFKEGGGILPKVQCETLPSGVYPITTTVTETGGGVSNPLYTQPSTPEFQESMTLYPECSTGTCMLDLRLGTTSCFQNPTACAEWFTDPNRESTYSCFFGTHAVELTECYVYGPSFTALALASGDTLGDPETGAPLGAPAGAAPGSDATTFGSTVQDPDANRECFPTGWAIFNPVEWVMKPVKCALEWAFVPSPTAVNAMVANVQQAWDNTVFTQVQPMVAQFAVLPTASGCTGIPINIEVTWPVPWAMHWNFGEACSGPMASTAALVKVISSAVISGYSVLALTRYIGGVIGYGGFGKTGSSE